MNNSMKVSPLTHDSEWSYIWLALSDPAAAKDSDPEDSPSHASSPAAPDGDLHHAMLLHEAATVVNLHAQAVDVQNIRYLVHVVLDLTTGNYTCWRNQILIVIGKYSLEDLILPGVGV
jgi:hypothetical protein